jgi:hypothetical protein
MENFAGLPAQDRAELIRAAAGLTTIPPAMLEKDFWVCWSLKRLFESDLRDKLMFKGGTSLSKVHHLIERFSEDIDLILRFDQVSAEALTDNRAAAGQKKFVRRVEQALITQMTDVVLPQVTAALGQYCSVTPDPNNIRNIKIGYPTDFPDRYLRSEILLEIGPLALWEPNAEYEVKPYVVDALSDHYEFPQPSCKVMAIKAERTFWEKATILHVEANRPEHKVQPSRYSRHYYDMVRLAEESSLRASALADLGLLASVVRFKTEVWPTSWASYDTATPGTFRLLPSPHVERVLRKDYDAMQEMIFGERPTFDEILSKLAELEAEINGLRIDIGETAGY